ncbi:unnamed protein product [Lymnaea stagnalis]|uniref:Uncharacterized protein n=1 Tax=Lymnaea stagnalis TaxID=6523 RepID=A0AAV2IMJ1_LYMST
MAAILKCLVIICRNYDNVLLVASCDFVKQAITIAQAVLSKLYNQTEQSSEPDFTAEKVVDFVKLVLHFLECLYDHYLVWRKRLKG